MVIGLVSCLSSSAHSNFVFTVIIEAHTVARSLCEIALVYNIYIHVFSRLSRCSIQINEHLGEFANIKMSARREVYCASQRIVLF